MAIRIDENVPLAPLTTLELGGTARHFTSAYDESELIEALIWAEQHGLAVWLLGGGSNLVVSDRGVGGLVIRIASRGLTFERRADGMLMEARAGEPWDDVVAETVRRGLAGLECLSGIPGLVGATPIQNVGAYGQEVSQTIQSVQVLDVASRAVIDLPAADCGFSYRDSAFKQQPGRYVVLAVKFALRPGGEPTVRYPELRNALPSADRVGLAEVQQTVLALRRRKSMVLDPADPNRRSVGSFFMNPIVSEPEADALVEHACSRRLIAAPTEFPRFPANGGRVKLAAGWLVERAGVPKGFRMGTVGVSTRHALALVHHGGGTTADLLRLARHVRQAVHERFGIWLRPEPVVLGATAEDPLALA